jgi:hypothetical protein
VVEISSHRSSFQRYNNLAHGSGGPGSEALIGGENTVYGLQGALGVVADCAK